MEIRVAIFVRVSKHSQDYERQIYDLQEYASKMGYRVERVIAEKVSGSAQNFSRAALSELRVLAHSGKIKKVLVTEVSRLGRRTGEVLSFIEELSNLGVSVYAHNYGLETLTSEGKRNPLASLLFTLLTEFARLERETLIERIHSGLEQARRRGSRLGRPPGSTKSEASLLKEYSTAARLLKSGYSVRNVAKIENISATTVMKVKKSLGL